MKKYLFAKISFFTLLLLVTTNAALSLNPVIKPTVNSANAAIAEAIDESVSTADIVDSEATILNKNAIVSTKATSVIALLLNPHIGVAIDNFFGKPTQYALYDAAIKEISQAGNDFVYKVTISVPTFHGAHNPPYGIEKMTFSIRPGEVALNDYMHQSKRH